jgi:NADPH:quinone reductase-like Zn-dependent oxidoreductase
MAWKSRRETTSMKAFILDRYGSADRVRAGDMPDPELREDDVLVQIHAAGVNLLDSKIRNGEFKRILRYRLPLILGHDVAGVVVRVGSRVRRFKPGDEVYARPADGRIGAFAEFIAIKEDDVAIKPTALTMEEAASIPLVGLTAWQALIERANLKKGQKVLIHAGSGGVGTLAIQLAKHVGATVATTTSTASPATTSWPKTVESVRSRVPVRLDPKLPPHYTDCPAVWGDPRATAWASGSGCRLV